MVKGAAPLRSMAIVLMALMLVATAAWLLSGHRPRPVDQAEPVLAVQVVDALTGRPLAHPYAAPDDAAPATAIATPATGGRDLALVEALARRGSTDMPMLAETVAIQPRVAADDAAEARATRLLSGHLRLAATGHPLRVRCAAALCEVTGTIASSAAAIEAPVLLEAVLAAGWTPGPVASAPAAGGTTDFLMYLNRESLQGEGR